MHQTRPSGRPGRLDREAPRSQELAHQVLGIAVPRHSHDLSWVDHDPTGLALKMDQAVRVELHAGQLAVVA